MLLIVLLKGKSSSNLGTGKFVLLELLTFICVAEQTGGKKIPSSWGCSGVTGVGDYDGIFFNRSHHEHQNQPAKVFKMILR